MTYQEMACHTWALSANPSTGADVNSKYEKLSGMFAEKYDFGGKLGGKSLKDVRTEAMQVISGLCDVRDRQLSNNVYLCGGFRSGQVCPEHLWLEDHTANISYDTFINQNIRMVGRVGKTGQPFQPGCESQAFAADEIARVSIKGFTSHQVDSISSHGEQV